MALTRRDFDSEKCDNNPGWFMWCLCMKLPYGFSAFINLMIYMKIAPIGQLMLKTDFMHDEASFAFLK